MKVLPGALEELAEYRRRKGGGKVPSIRTISTGGLPVTCVN